MLNTLWLRIAPTSLGVMDTILELASSKYAIIGYLAVLVLIIAVLVIFMLTNDSKGGAVQATTVEVRNEGTGAPLRAPVASTQIEGTHSAEDEEERAPRFCMLSRIDEGKRVYDARKYEEETSL